MHEDLQDNCLCGHNRMMHDLGENWSGYCLLCFGEKMDMIRGKHKFCLNNLDYIEKLAKKRKLI
jgi:hypothetical protein